MEEDICLRRGRLELINREWRLFKLSDYFIVRRGGRLTENNRVLGKRPLVTAGFNNSGISGFIGNIDQEIFPKDTITIDMFANAFFRNYEYSADDNILVLMNPELSPEVKLFITSIFDSTNQFSYGKQYRLNNFKRQKIMLPSNSNGSPDFEFMEQYIKFMEKRVLERVKSRF